MDPLRVALLVEEEQAVRSELAALLWLSGMRVRLVRDPRLLSQLIGADTDVRLVVMAAEFGGQRGGDWMAEMSRQPSWSAVAVIATTDTPGSVFACALRSAQVPVLAKPIEGRALRKALVSLGFPVRRPPHAFAQAASLTLTAVENCRLSEALRRQIKQRRAKA